MSIDGIIKDNKVYFKSQKGSSCTYRSILFPWLFYSFCKHYSFQEIFDNLKILYSNLGKYLINEIKSQQCVGVQTHDFQMLVSYMIKDKLLNNEFSYDEMDKKYINTQFTIEPFTYSDKIIEVVENYPKEVLSDIINTIRKKNHTMTPEIIHMAFFWPKYEVSKNKGGLPIITEILKTETILLALYEYYNNSEKFKNMLNSIDVNNCFLNVNSDIELVEHEELWVKKYLKYIYENPKNINGTCLYTLWDLALSDKFQIYKLLVIEYDLEWFGKILNTKINNDTKFNNTNSFLKFTLENIKKNYKEIILSFEREDHYKFITFMYNNLTYFKKKKFQCIILFYIQYVVQKCKYLEIELKGLIILENLHIFTEKYCFTDFNHNITFMENNKIYYEIISVSHQIITNNKIYVKPDNFDTNMLYKYFKNLFNEHKNNDDIIDILSELDYKKFYFINNPIATYSNNTLKIITIIHYYIYFVKIPIYNHYTEICFTKELQIIVKLCYWKYAKI